MKNDRPEVLTNVKQSLARKPAAARVEMPEYDLADLTCESRMLFSSLRQSFYKNFQAVNGLVIDTAAELIMFLKKQGGYSGYCDPKLHETIGNRLKEESGFTISKKFERNRADEYAFGITQATGAIAESGSLILNDYDTSDRLAALAPWIHIAVLKESQIHRTISDAIAAMGDCPNTVWVTGPSKTADIEGILVEGVHGPGIQVAFLVDED